MTPQVLFFVVPSAVLLAAPQLRSNVFLATQPIRRPTGHPRFTDADLPSGDALNEVTYAKVIGPKARCLVRSIAVTRSTLLLACVVFTLLLAGFFLPPPFDSHAPVSISGDGTPLLDLPHLFIPPLIQLAFLPLSSNISETGAVLVPLALDPARV